MTEAEYTLRRFRDLETNTRIIKSPSKYFKYLAKRLEWLQNKIKQRKARSEPIDFLTEEMDAICWLVCKYLISHEKDVPASFINSGADSRIRYFLKEMRR